MADAAEAVEDGMARNAERAVMANDVLLWREQWPADATYQSRLNRKWRRARQSLLSPAPTEQPTAAAAAAAQIEEAKKKARGCRRTRGRRQKKTAMATRWPLVGWAGLGWPGLAWPRPKRRPSMSKSVARAAPSTSTCRLC